MMSCLAIQVVRLHVDMPSGSYSLDCPSCEEFGVLFEHWTAEASRCSHTMCRGD